MIKGKATPLWHKYKPNYLNPSIKPLVPPLTTNKPPPVLYLGSPKIESASKNRQRDTEKKMKTTLRRKEEQDAKFIEKIMQYIINIE